MIENSHILLSFAVLWFGFFCSLFWSSLIKCLLIQGLYIIFIEYKFDSGIKFSLFFHKNLVRVIYILEQLDTLVSLLFLSTLDNWSAVIILQDVHLNFSHLWSIKTSKGLSILLMFQYTLNWMLFIPYFKMVD